MTAEALDPPWRNSDRTIEAYSECGIMQSIFSLNAEHF
jgi:hypothetical protein